MSEQSGPEPTKEYQLDEESMRERRALLDKPIPHGSTVSHEVSDKSESKPGRFRGVFSRIHLPHGAERDGVRLKRSAFAIAAGAVAVNIILGHEWSIDEDDYDCTGPTRELVHTPGEDNALDLFTGIMDHIGVMNGNRQVKNIAESLSEDRGYIMTAEGLAAADPVAPYIVFDDEGRLMQDVNEGVNCIALPPPVVVGEELIRENQTLQEIAYANLVAPELLKIWNPDLASVENDEVLENVGETIMVKGQFDTRFVLQTATGTLAEMSNGNPILLSELLVANAAPLASGNSVNEGDLAFLPFGGLDDNENTPEEVIQAFKDAGYWPIQPTK